MKLLLHALREGNPVLHEGNLALKEGQPRVYSEEEAFKELENKGVEEELQFLAYDFITSNPGLMRIFFGCPSHQMQSMAGSKGVLLVTHSETEYEYFGWEC